MGEGEHEQPPARPPDDPETPSSEPPSTSATAGARPWEMLPAKERRRGSGPTARPRARRRRSWLPELAIVLALVLAVAAVRLDLGSRWFGLEPEDPVADPAGVSPPAGLSLAAQGAAPAVAAPGSAGSLDPAKVAQAVAPYVADPRLGPHLDVLVARADGTVVYRRGSGTVTPASTMKLLTSTAALETLGPTTRFRTTVAIAPAARAGAVREVVLRGGGDPFLVSSRAAAAGLYPRRADLGTLAARTAAALRAQQVGRVRLGYDASLFTGPRVNPAWPASYLSEDVVPPITALWADEGKDPGGDGYSADPAATAASTFRDALRAQGIRVPAPATARTTPAGATELAGMSSATVGQIVQRTLSYSDNNAAEVLAHHVGRAGSGQASFAGGAQSVVAALGTLGISTAGDRLVDGSGLSRTDRLSPETLLAVLRTAAGPAHPELRDVITGLPVAGFTGSLRYRFDDGPPGGRGRIRAKTGTLTGVHGLAGVGADVQGDQLFFVAIADRVAVPNTLAARAAIDDLADALGACRCRP